MQKLKTFFLNFRTLKHEFVERLTQLTSERLVGEHILQNYSRLVKRKTPNQELLEKYRKLCNISINKKEVLSNNTYFETSIPDPFMEKINKIKQSDSFMEKINKIKQNIK
jgi:hypothetical protein